MKTLYICKIMRRKLTGKMSVEQVKLEDDKANLETKFLIYNCCNSILNDDAIQCIKSERTP